MEITDLVVTNLVSVPLLCFILLKTTQTHSCSDSNKLKVEPSGVSNSAITTDVTNSLGMIGSVLRIADI